MSRDDDDYDMGDLYRAQAEASKTKRASNREFSTQLLRDAGIQFTEHNGGAHLIVANGAYDFYPGTGLFIDRTTKQKKRGVRSLIAKVMRAAGAATKDSA